ncbi:MAG: heavy-metal-associated domain-containing protein [Elusimicrobia bacterium]|nr:heavy-metal-associated domain-containing protein [Elusimicrobiota bacterium]
MKVKLTVKAMDCGGCIDEVEEAVGKLLGVSSAIVNPKTSEISLEFDESKVSLSDIRETIEKTGFETI